MQIFDLDAVFFFNDTATTEIYTLSLHDALPILSTTTLPPEFTKPWRWPKSPGRSEEHTSELQSHSDLVCRLLLEKKNNSRYKSLDTLKLKIITVTLRRLIRTKHKTATKMQRQEK